LRQEEVNSEREWSKYICQLPKQERLHLTSECSAKVDEHPRNSTGKEN